MSKQYIGLTIIIFVIFVISFVIMETEAVEKAYTASTVFPDMFMSLREHFSPHFLHPEAR